MNQKSFLRNAAIMIASSFLLRGAGMWFRIYLSEKLGPGGMGTYQLIFSVFTAAVAMATSGMFLVSSRLTSERFGTGQRGAVRGAVFKCALWGLFQSLPAAAALCALSGVLADTLLGNPETAEALRILALGLPFMSCCAVLRGYFVARENALPPALAEAAEQLVTVLIPLLLLPRAQTLSGALAAVMLGSSAGEATSCLCLFLRYRFDLRRVKLPAAKSEKLLGEIVRISLPGTVASTARHLLGSGENLLIPRMLCAAGLSAGAALSQYGVLHAMAIPVLTFPAAILVPFSSLLIPAIAAARVREEKDAMQETIAFSLRFSLLFSIWMSCEFWAFAPYLGEALFPGGQVSVYLRVLAPLLPLWYADNAVDGVLKGLDQQFSSCRFNLYDGALRIALVLLLIPRLRMGGYVAVLFASAIFNGFLSLRRMLRVSQFEFPVFRFVFLPLFCGVFSVFLSKILPIGELLQLALSSVLFFLFYRVLTLRPFCGRQKNANKACIRFSNDVS